MLHGALNYILCMILLFVSCSALAYLLVRGWGLGTRLVILSPPLQLHVWIAFQKPYINSTSHFFIKISISTVVYTLARGNF